MPLSAVRKATSSMSSIAQTIAVPHEHPPTRLPSFPNLERTSVIPTVATSTVSVAAGTKRDFLIIRNPTYPLWTECVRSTNAFSVWGQYPVIGPTFNSAGDSFTFAQDAFNVIGQGGTDVTFWENMKNRYPLGVIADGRTFVKAASNGLSAIQLVTTNAFIGSIRALVEVFDGAEVTSVVVDIPFDNGGAATTQGVALSANSWGPWFRVHSLTLVSATTAPGNFIAIRIGITSGTNLVNPTGSALAWFAPMFAPPEITNSSIPYSSTRANAAAVLFSNVTAVLDKEGTINCARVPRTNTAASNSYWSGTTAGSFEGIIASVHPIDRYFGPMEKGLYMFTLPDQSSEVFRDHVDDITYVGSTYTTGRIHLDSFDYAQVVTMSDLGGNGSTMAVTQDVHLEFRSSSMLFTSGFSTVALESYHVAQMALAKQGVFYENPVHLAAIANMVRSAVSALAPVVMPYVRSAAGAVGNMLLNKGTGYINSKMNQAHLVEAPRSAPKPRKSRPKPKARSKGKTRK